MFYYLYEIRNLVNNKIYIGVHKTSNLDDGYMGSGQRLAQAIKKYGILNFQKTILEFFETQEEMFIKESEIVTEEFLQRDDVYNLKLGGFGGFDYINSTNIPKFKGKSHSPESKKKMGHLGNKYAVGNSAGKKNLGRKHIHKECPHCKKSCPVNVFLRYHKDCAGKVFTDTHQSSKLK